METAGPPEPRTVLVVEDDDATLRLLVENLAADGFRAAGATSAGEGLRAIEVRRPSLVLLDIALESGRGLDLLDRVRAADGLASRIDPDLPVIVLTGRAGEGDRVRSFARGADDHVCKPSWSSARRSTRAGTLPECCFRVKQERQYGSALEAANRSRPQQLGAIHLSPSGMSDRPQ